MGNNVYPVLTSAEVQDVLQRRMEGWTWERVEVYLRRPRKIIMRDLRAYGIAPLYERKKAVHEPQAPVPSAQWPSETIQRMIEMHLRGLGAGAIGQAIGKSRNAVLGKLHRQGYSRETKSSVPVPIPPPVVKQRAPTLPVPRQVPTFDRSGVQCVTPGCRNPRQRSVGLGTLCSTCERDRIANKRRGNA